MTTPLVPDAVQASGHRFTVDPNDPTSLIVVGPDGIPFAGSYVTFDQTNIHGDSKHDATKGPTGNSDDGTKRFRLRFSNTGTPYGEEIP